VNPRRALPIVLLGALLHGAPSTLVAKDAAEQRTWSVEDSEEVRSRLAEAERLGRRGVDDRAGLLLQEVLDRFPDHLVRDADDAYRYVGARPHVHRLIAALPEAARAAYERAVGGAAAQALDAAVRSRDPAILEEVAERYLMVRSVGPRALVLLTDLRSARGEADRALPAVRRLRREFPGHPLAGPAAVAREARLLARLGDAAGLESLRVSCDVAMLDQPVAAGDGATTVGAILATATTESGTVPKRDDSPTLGGDGTRRGHGIPLDVLGTPRWEEPSSRFQWTSIDYRQAGQESSVSQAMQAAEPVVPAVVDGVVYLHWNFDLVARDLYSGRILWKFSTDQHATAENGRTHMAMLAAPAVADGVVFAPLQVIPPSEARRTVVFQNQDIIPFIPHRRLYAVEAATGRLLWSHDDPEEKDDPFRGPLANINVNSAPLVVGDLVIASGCNYRGQFTAWTFAAERATGRIRWFTRLGYGQQELNLFGRPVKEIAIAAAATDGDRVFVLSNMGIVSCLDAATGRPLWTRGYKQSTMPFYENFWTTPERAFTFTGSPPVVSVGVLVTAPSDSEEILAMDAVTGEMLWTLRSSQGRMAGGRITRLLGADETHVYTAGTGVKAIPLRGDGTPSWSREFDQTRDLERSSGRGVLSGSRLMVPTTHALYTFDTANGKLVIPKESLLRTGHRNSLDAGGGNLVTAEGAAVLARLDAITGYFSEEDIRARVATRLAKAPGDPDALLEAARVLLGAGRPEEALPYFERALEVSLAVPGERSAQRARAAREGLFQIHIARAEERLAAADIGAAAESYRTAASKAPTPEGAARSLLLAVTLRTERGIGDAAPILDEILRDHADVVLGEDDGGPSTAAALALRAFGLAAFNRGDGKGAADAFQRMMERPPTDLLAGIPARSVARIALDEVIQRFGRSVYASHEAAAVAAHAAARTAGDAGAMAEVARRWPNAAVTARAMLDESRLRLERDDTSGAVEAARRLLAEGPEGAEEAEALWLLASGLARSGRAAMARITLDRLLHSHADVVLDVDGTPQPVSSLVKRRMAESDLAPVAAATAPRLLREGKWKALWDRPLAGPDDEIVLPVSGESWSAPRILVAGPGFVEALDATRGTTAWRVPIEDRPFRAVLLSGHVILVSHEGLTARSIDVGSGGWFRPSGDGFILDAVTVDGLLLVLEAGSEGRPSRVVAVDPGDGGDAWPAPVVMHGDYQRLLPMEHGALAIPASSRSAAFRAVDTGRAALRNLGIALRAPGEGASAEVISTEGSILVRRFASLVAYRPANGVPVWTLPAPGSRLIVAVKSAGDAVALADHRETLEVLEASSGTSRWVQRIRPERRLLGAPGALAGDGASFFTVSALRAGRGDVRIEAWNAGDGAPRWSTLVSEDPVLVELDIVDGLLIARSLLVGGGRLAVHVIDPVGGSVLHAVEDERLGGESLEVHGGTGVLAVITDNLLLVRGVEGR
jgi:outer membrane protein assembly factor BamB